MLFKRETNEEQNIVTYMFTNENVENILYIQRESSVYDKKDCIKNTIIWGVVQNNKFSLNIESGNSNIFQLRNIIFQILDDFKKEFVSSETTEIYDITFSEFDKDLKEKYNFSYKSLVIKYGQENVIMEGKNSLIVLINVYN